jgi:uncharacterized OB-fold protein
MTDKKPRIPIKEGWFYIPDAPGKEPYLIGSKCSQCGYTHFPKMVACPVCRKDGVMKEVPLSRKGKLDCFTVAHQGPPGFETPYIQAYVLLPEGIKIFTLIEGVKPLDNALKTGQEMELILSKVREDESGNEIISWKFRPAAEARINGEGI